jgi:hypothetical protein
MKPEVLRTFLDRVEGNLGGSRKADILLEIESHIWDRAEALARERGFEEPGDPEVQRAIEELGDPSDLAVSYSGERSLISPKEYSAFWYFTGLLFAVHLGMLLLATVTQARFDFFPFNVLPAAKLSGASAVVTVVSLAVQAFLFDTGLVLMVFFLLRRSFRRVEMPNLTFRVESSMRPSLVRALFAVVVALLVAVPAIRDSLFTVRISGEEDGVLVHTLFRQEFSAELPWILSFLALAATKDVLYAWLRERPFTLGLDLLTAVAGMVLSLHLAGGPDFVGLPSDFPLDDGQIQFFNEVLARVLSLFFIVWTALFAARAVKRFARLRQVWGEER